jgi:hypothetical protein
VEEAVEASAPPPEKESAGGEGEGEGGSGCRAGRGRQETDRRRGRGARRETHVGSWTERMKKGERYPENERARGAIRILQMRLQLPLEPLWCPSPMHFEDAVGDAIITRDSLRPCLVGKKLAKITIPTPVARFVCLVNIILPWCKIRLKRFGS